MRQTSKGGKATLAARVDKIIKPKIGNGPEKAEIVLDDCEPFYREIRIENKLKDSAGEDVALKPGAPVEVVVEAEEEHTTKPNAA
jgi:hypothetical protein